MTTQLRTGGRDKDIYGRKLRLLKRDGKSIANTLVAEGLARPWDGARRISGAMSCALVAMFALALTITCTVAGTASPPRNIFACGGTSWSITILNPSEVQKINPHTNCKNEILALNLNGTIDSNSLSLMKNYAKIGELFKNTHMFLFLDSIGGDIQIAMEIGMIVWNKRMTVVVGTANRLFDQCLSACVLIYAAGVHRSNLGFIAIHRPSFMDNNIDSAQIFVKRYEPVFTTMQNYLDQFGVARGVIDLMRTTPSTKLRFLSEQELEDFGLGSDNVAYEEIKYQTLKNRCGSTYADKHLAAFEEIERTCMNKYGINMVNCSNSILKIYDVNQPRICK